MACIDFVIMKRYFNSELYSDPCQISKMERFVKIINGWKPLTFFAEHFILEVGQGSEYTCSKGSILI